MSAPTSSAGKTKLYPILFNPIFKERIWGGQNLARLYQKALPPDRPIGESWEIVDRPGDESVIANGEFAGKTLRWLMENHHQELLGPAARKGDRFPLLIKILDAKQKLSLQVHPPADKAGALGGEPKTEMWFITAATPEADLFAGLRRGVTREQFEQELAKGTVANCFHRLPVVESDALFLPSGRVHAIGAGNVIFEIQENSDTTYRVFDWNRLDDRGQPRELHVEKSLASIDFNDFEPNLLSHETVTVRDRTVRPLVQCAQFDVALCHLRAGRSALIRNGVKIIGVVAGGITVTCGCDLKLSPGQFCLLPAELTSIQLTATSDASYLDIGLG